MQNAAELAQAAKEERDVLSDFAVRIRTELGLAKGAFTVSMGSTPTCSHLPSDMREVTEIHPGNYVFYDRTQMLLGSCTPSDCAATVLATVLAHYRDTHRLLIDAGALALSKGKALVFCAIAMLVVDAFPHRSGLHASGAMPGLGHSGGA